uniref:Uncharacterized protein n=1 Tax=Ciona savignyi TaxID=51511 RepID=H2YX00_CIOSA
MSLSKTVYGGFPGPPERRQDGSSQSRQERRQPRGFIPPHGVSNQAEQFQPNVAEFYSNSTAGYLPPDLHYDGRGYETPNLFYPAEFPNQPTYFGPNYMMGGSTTYPGTSMPHAFESPGFYADDMTAHFTENQHYQTMLPDNSSAAGKSRRFSRQRNIKESGTSGEMYNPKLTAEDCRPHKNDRRSHQFKQPIRFSHQKENQNGKKPENIKGSGSKNTQAKGMNESKPEKGHQKVFPEV